MLVEHRCSKCEVAFPTKQKLNRHLNKQFPCDEGNCVCRDCNKHFRNRSSLSEHRKLRCPGHPPQSREQMQAIINDLTERTSRLKTELDEVLDEAETERTEPDVGLIPQALVIDTVTSIDVDSPQLYFLEAGPGLVPIMPFSGIVIKFGVTDDPYRRITTHQNDFLGGRLTDSIKCSHPAALEKKFKKWIKLSGRQVKSKANKKNTVDTEVFVVKNQDEYAQMVRQAIIFAAEVGERTDMLAEMREYLDMLKTHLAMVGQL